MDVFPLAVSSLGMPGAGLDAFLAVAQRHGCSAVELRVAAGEPVHLGLDASGRAAVRQACAAAGLSILSLGSYVRICAPGEDAPVLDLLDAHLRLAADVGAAGVRVFPGGDGTADDERGRARLARAATVADALGVTVLVETHDSHPTGADVARLLTAPGSAPVGVIWDAVHPWVAGEEPEQTAAALGGRLAYVQIKDVATRRRGAGPVVPGEGVVPLDALAAVLRDIGYAQPISLEWEKPWHPQIPDLDTALGATTRRLGRAPEPDHSPSIT
jgi:sugar phosphate isomerase/epimerase